MMTRHHPTTKNREPRDSALRVPIILGLLLLLLVSPTNTVDQKLVGLARPAAHTDSLVLPDAAHPTQKAKAAAVPHKPTGKPPVKTTHPKTPAKKLSGKHTPAGSKKVAKNTKKKDKGKKNKRNSKKSRGGKKGIHNKKGSKPAGKRNKQIKGSKKGGKVLRKRKIRYYHKPSANVTRYLHNLTIAEEKKHAQIVQNLTKVEKNLGKVEKRIDQLGMRNFRLTMRKQVHKLLDKLQYKGNVKIMIRRDPPKDPLDFRGEMKNAEDRSPIHHKMNSIMSKGNVPLKKLIHSLEPKVNKKSPTLKDRFSARWKKEPKNLKKPESSANIPAVKLKALPLTADTVKKPIKRRMRGRKVHRRYRKGKLPKFYESDEDPEKPKPILKMQTQRKGRQSNKKVSKKTKKGQKSKTGRASKKTQTKPVSPVKSTATA